MQSSPPSPNPEPEEGRYDWLSTSIIVPIAIVGVVAAIIIGIVLVAQEDQQEGITTLGASTVVAETLPQTVPFQQLAGHLVVDVALGSGRETVPMILDTGAPTIVSADLAERFGGEVTGSIVSASIDGEVTSSPVVPFSSVTVGGAEFRDVGGVAGFIAPGNPLYCISGHGLIGATLMKDAVWQIDYSTQQVTIASSVEGLDHIDGAISLAFTPASEGSPSPIIEIPAGDGTLRLLLDTGSDGWLTVNPLDLEGTGASVDSDSPTVATIGAGATGTFETSLVWTALDMQFGEQELAAVPMATTVTLAEGQGNIGNAFLSNYVVTIDWPESTLYLDPVTDDPRPHAPASSTLSWDGSDYIVGSIVEGAPGTDDLALTATVTAIDGEDVTAATFDEFCMCSTGDQASSYEMTVAGDVPTTVDVAPVEDFFEALSR